MGQLNILGRVPLDLDISPWWEDTYEESTQGLSDTMDLVEGVIQKARYHLTQAQVQVNLAKKTAEILSSSSTRSAQYAYTWWDWVFKGCAIVSAVIFIATLIQCCDIRCALRSLRRATHSALVLSPL